ncbi:purine-nucleoside phosphorylase [Nocardiopsis chromatogenes]|uniref:purine-nucleoside phosphorylase n=1 Tax=Nocardiopsis chromatogenes TaxID=280239 RepID=UPI00034DD9C1|nr:purine-nucleoside phosphorylase [Nocardiopsis chromatogenes]
MSTDPIARAGEAADALRERTGTDSFRAAVVLGSGWGPAADALGETVEEVPVTDLPGFPPPAVTGHAGTVRAVRSGGGEVLVFLGRTHLYEGHGADAVAHAVRTAVQAGAQTIVLTNAAGGLRSDVPVGSPVLIADHINLTARSPLTGAEFVDLTTLYDPRLRALAHEVDPSLPEGVYAAMPGPQFETPAEIRMLRALGADLVGMSTALEAIAARSLGASVLGISLVTNIAAGLSDQPLGHKEVLDTGREAAAGLGGLLAGVVGKL